MKHKSSTAQQATAKAYIKQKPSFWSAFFQGMANIWPASPRDYIHPTGGGFAADNKALRSDFGAISMDMRKVLKKYEQTDSNKLKI